MADRVMISKSSEETFELGRALGLKLRERVLGSGKGFKVGFKGTLGAGKTLMIKGLMSGLCPGQDVRSPSFTIVNEYQELGRRVLHADLYRIYSVDELLGTGFLEALHDDESVVLVEWIDHLTDKVDNMMLVEIEPDSEDTRKITLRNWSE